jgi:hypothetical protein
MIEQHCGELKPHGEHTWNRLIGDISIHWSFDPVPPDEDPIPYETIICRGVHLTRRGYM